MSEPRSPSGVAENRRALAQEKLDFGSRGEDDGQVGLWRRLLGNDFDLSKLSRREWDRPVRAASSVGHLCGVYFGLEGTATATFGGPR